MSDTRTPGEPMRNPSEAAGRAAEQGRFAGAQAATGASAAAGQVKQEAAGAVQDLKAEGAGLAEAAKDRAQGFVETQQRAGAEQAEGLARAVHGAADQLQQSSPQIAHYVHEAASAVDGLARNLRDSNPGQLLGRLETMARRQPVAFFGAAVLAGFALARFAKASAEGTQYGSASHGGASFGGATSGASHGRGQEPAAIGGGTPVPHSTAGGAPGWVQGKPGETPRPATVAAASLGGAAARSTAQAGQTRPVNEAG
ncbi:hypothetical protein [Paracraurococcus lichenis]|uniref:Uncharacterized protein n=1 Tax=Paracraurococcus lichenis TaxID=3064888 RepID=A0ABT9DSC1_9PROT|nr:hypothetical protein [Paracraurococcus sp. LOR1-02]MDO9706796.1 hypothetical protein [Paracraurococcus sp. LOR1-02]